jgi:hypothetical protein
MSSLTRQFLLISVSLSFLVGCASTYSLAPVSKKPEKLNGIEMETAVSPKCVLQAGSQSANKEEMLVRVKITNKSGGAFDLDPTVFSLTGGAEVLKSSPIRAADPELYLKDLQASTEVLDSRTQMQTYQGIEELGTLKTSGSDREIESARDQYKIQQRDAVSARRNAEDLRARAAAIRSSALRKTSVKPGESAEGTLIFKSAFLDEGPVAIESGHPICAGTLQFRLEK